MEKLKRIIALLCVTGIYSCTSTKQTVSDPNIGNIEVEIKAIAGNDSLVRTKDGDVIGKIDEYGEIYDPEGKRIGKRKLTDQELIKQAGL
jgi:hypothetical protein